jgi:ketosteroid isomerase-like protein
MSRENVEIVLRGVAALNRGDPEAFNAVCDARFEMRLVGAVGEPVSYVGADGVFQFFRDMDEIWEDWGFEVEQARDLDQEVLMTGA